MEWTKSKESTSSCSTIFVVVVVANVVNDYSNDCISETLPNPEKLS